MREERLLPLRHREGGTKERYHYFELIIEALFDLLLAFRHLTLAVPLPIVDTESRVAHGATESKTKRTLLKENISILDMYGPLLALYD